LRTKPALTRCSLTSGRFKVAYRLTLVDAIIAAFAVRHEAILLHKDPEFQALASRARLEALPYKGA